MKKNKICIMLATIDDFQIGDRVLYIYSGVDSNSREEISGLEGTVVDLKKITVGVEFDVNIRVKYGVMGHSCEGIGKDGHCRYLNPQELENFKPLKPERIRWYKKGKLSENMSKIEKNFEAFKFQKVESVRMNYYDTKVS